MLVEWGPFITIPAIVSSAVLAILAAWSWIGGYVAWLIVNGKNPSWMEDSLDFPTPSSKSSIRRYKPHHIYLYKGIAWSINILWACGVLFTPPKEVLPYKPIIGQVTLLDIGAIISELMIFFLLTSLYKWLVWRSRE